MQPKSQSDQQELLEQHALLLKNIANGEQEKVTMQIKENPALLLLKGKVSEDDLIDNHGQKYYIGRTFEDITALQLACWNLDKHMWQVIIDCFAENNLFNQAAQQLSEIDSKNPPIYVKTYGAHYDFKLVISAYTEYQAFSAANKTKRKWNASTLQAAGELWLKIGKLQLGFPRAFVSEICRPDRSFQPIPQYDDATLPRVYTFFDITTNQLQHWYKPTVIGRPTSQGVQVCTSRVFRGGLQNGAWNGCANGEIKMDADAIDAYRKKRLSEFNQLRVTVYKKVISSLYPKNIRITKTRANA